MRPIKFDLPLNGTRIATLEQLEKNLTPEILEPFRSEKLAKWLRVRSLDEQAGAVEMLLAGDVEREVQLLKGLYGLFGGEADNDLLQVAIAERKRSLPLSQESYDMELEAIKADFAKKELAYQQEIELLKNPPKPKVVETRIGQFIARDDGVALDIETGLTWCRFAHGQKWQNNTASGNGITTDWDSASKVAKEFNQQGGYAGYTDWRLPTINELSTLMNKIDDINHIAVFTKIYNYFWSSSEYDNYYAHCVSFSHGKRDWLGKSNKYHVRLVRS
jgi:hypothetical protein